MPEKAWLADEEVGYPAGVGGDRLHQPAVGRGVGAERGGRRPDRTLQHRRLTVVERMGERGGRVDPFQAMLL